MSRKPPDIDKLATGIEAGERASLARAITLAESTRPDHRAAANALLARLLPRTGSAIRVGISGPPGAGKSTMIEKLGVDLCAKGHRVAVLAIDPSSTVRGGSILGDKTRMGELANHPDAFVRPTPSSGALGGVHDRTREALLLCEAAGFDIVIVETVGVGQSETAVSRLVDTLVVLLIAGAGDELQGIKKGVLEVADIVAINKADGDNKMRARRARKDFRAALHLVRPRSQHWSPPVLLASAMESTGLDELWAKVLEHRSLLQSIDVFDDKRESQRVDAMWHAVERGLMARLRRDPDAQAVARDVLDEVKSRNLTPGVAAQRIMDAFAPDD